MLAISARAAASSSSSLLFASPRSLFFTRSLAPPPRRLELQQNAFSFAENNTSKRTTSTVVSVAAASDRRSSSIVMGSSSSPPTIGTHNGSFHCDEALGVALLRRTQEFADAKVVRSRTPEVLDKCDVVIDVGGVYDPAAKRFDHHQKEFNDVFGHGEEMFSLAFDLCVSVKESGRG